MPTDETATKQFRTRWTVAAVLMVAAIVAGGLVVPRHAERAAWITLAYGRFVEDMTDLGGGRGNGFFSRVDLDDPETLKKVIGRPIVPADKEILLRNSGIPVGSRGEDYWKARRAHTDVLLAYARAHPDNLSYLWHWWRLAGERMGNMALGIDYIHFPHPSIVSDNDRKRLDEQARKDLEDWREYLAVLQEMDPDNGWTLFVEAWPEAQQGIAYNWRPLNPGEPRGLIADEEKAETAARLLHRMVRCERFTMEIDRLSRERFALLGEGRAFPDALAAMAVQAGTLLPDLPRLRDFARRLTVEAERRAESSEPMPDGLSAYDILHDLQTMGIRMMENADTLIDILVAQRVIQIATGDGADILDAAGRPEEAEALLARGRRLLEPFLVRRLANGPGSARLYDDPELEARADALPPRDTTLDDALEAGDGGFLPGTLMTFPWQRGFVTEMGTRADLFPARNREIYGGLLRWPVFAALSIAYLAAFLLTCVLSLRHWWKTRNAPASAFPSVGRMILPGVAVFVVAWALPAVLTAYLILADGFPDWIDGSLAYPTSLSAVLPSASDLPFGSVLIVRWMAIGMAWLWSGVAAFLVATVLARSGTLLGAGTMRQWVIGSAAALGLSAVFFILLLTLPDAWFSDPNPAAPSYALVIAAARFLLGASIFSFVVALCPLFLIWYCPRRPRAEWRVVLPSLSVGFLLWLTIAPSWADWQDRRWAARDRLLVPRVSDEICAFTRAESRVVSEWRAHARAQLAAETGDTPGEEHP